MNQLTIIINSPIPLVVLDDELEDFIDSVVFTEDDGNITIEEYYNSDGDEVSHRITEYASFLVLEEIKEFLEELLEDNNE